MFPFYENDQNEGWIFSVLDCQCSRQCIAAALEEGLINSAYHDLLILNLHAGQMKEQSFQPI